MEAKEIAKLAQIASVLEVSGWPKPGNVHRTRNYDDMVFQDFAISAVVIGDTMEAVASQAKEIDDLSEAELGRYIFQAVDETNRWIETNTNLGIMMMCIPIAAAASISNGFDEIQENVGRLMDATTVEDAVSLYDAINVADAGGMGDQDEFDVMSEKAKDELRANNQTMFDVLEISSGWDRLANELTNKMPVCFKIGYPCYSSFWKTSDDVDVINKATVLTFMTILSQIPDTLISRKYGDEVAEDVSQKASDILEFKDDDSFLEKLLEFDDYLYENKLNPGTTADLTAASIFLSYLADNF
ncbi:MAG: triphosphoribosyl-dephospho-CoA synthase [Methanobrevibacter ruminantium]|uniref:triphosphoribosyl-dephospho-CoA synthase n=1 Tax=Methanobrevibacter ruminantium TaxID=83816 RepID=UPI0026EFE27D|nr:triphosphoribosyl-dephospho-CoA synthase [Methanobrevibacter ruminantium]MDO5843450.1 triphosphoribosyl-dephospho-CoA synthase [Methanobrevibacter ruminantium]